MVTDPKELFSNQRHQFILQYYSMAVQDLSRHLGIGWQTFTSLAGTVAVIGLAEDKKLPPPFAVSAAIGVAYWGILNILDASFWATRAIAFLANVEAVYFYEPERRVFNAYVGSHPPLKVFDSLRYQLYAALIILGLALVYYAKKIADLTNGFSSFLAEVKSHSHFSAFYWTLPIFIFLIMLDRTLTGRYHRIKDYFDFVDQCPGPGLVRDYQIIRGMDLGITIDPAQLLSGPELQRPLRESLKVATQRWSRIMRIGRLGCRLCIVAALMAVIFKNSLFP